MHHSKNGSGYTSLVSRELRSGDFTEGTKRKEALFLSTHPVRQVEPKPYHPKRLKDQISGLNPDPPGFCTTKHRSSLDSPQIKRGPFTKESCQDEGVI